MKTIAEAILELDGTGSGSGSDSGGAGGGVMVVTFTTADDGNTFTVDKSVASIIDAIESNCYVFAYVVGLESFTVVMQLEAFYIAHGDNDYVSFAEVSIGTSVVKRRIMYSEGDGVEVFVDDSSDGSPS